jgi:hypothetical protein
MPEPLTINDTERGRERGLINRLREAIRGGLRQRGVDPRGNAGPGARTQR